jgi:hypothetical protein
MRAGVGASVTAKQHTHDRDHLAPFVSRQTSIRMPNALEAGDVSQAGAIKCIYSGHFIPVWLAGGSKEQTAAGRFVSIGATRNL